MRLLIISVLASFYGFAQNSTIDTILIDNKEKKLFVLVYDRDSLASVDQFSGKKPFIFYNSSVKVYSRQRFGYTIVRLTPLEDLRAADLHDYNNINPPLFDDNP